MTWRSSGPRITALPHAPNPSGAWVAAALPIRHAELPFWEFVHGD